MILSALLVGSAWAWAVEGPFPNLAAFQKTLLQEVRRQAPEPLNQEPEEFYGHSDIDTVAVFVSVKNTTGKPLAKKNFRVFEDGAAQTVRHVLSTADQPVTLGLLVDDSGSLRRNRKKLLHAVRFFIQNRLPEDELFPVSFSDRPYLLLDGEEEESPKRFIQSEEEFEDFLAGIETRGNTVLYEAVGASAQYAKDHGSHIKRVLLLLSDGEDLGSSISLQEALKAAHSTDVQIYALGIPNPVGSGDQGKDTLKKLTKETGGVALSLDSSLQDASQQEIETACRRLLEEIRNQYLVTYRSNNKTRNGAYRRILVEALNSRGGRLKVRHREGYYAPKDPPGESQ